MNRITSLSHLLLETAKKCFVVVCLSIVLLTSITPAFEAKAQPVFNENFVNPTQTDTENFNTLFDLSELFIRIICPFDPTLNPSGQKCQIPTQLTRQEKFLVSQQKNNIDETVRKLEISAKNNAKFARENPAVLRRRYEKTLAEASLSERQKASIRRLVEQEGGIIEFTKSKAERVLADLPEEKIMLSKTLENYSDPNAGGETSQAKPSPGWCNIFSNLFVVAAIQGNVPAAAGAGLGVYLYCEF